MSPNKRQRESYTVSEKLSMVKKYQSENPPTSIRKFSLKYGIPANTFKHWVQNFENGIPDELKSVDSQTRKRIRPGKFPKLEKQVIDYIRIECINHPNNTITWLTLREKCNEWIKNLMSEKELEESPFSNSWLLRVLRRNSLSQYIDGISNINTNNITSIRSLNNLINDNNDTTSSSSSSTSSLSSSNNHSSTNPSSTSTSTSTSSSSSSNPYEDLSSFNTNNNNNTISYNLALESIKNIVKYVTDNNLIDITNETFKIYSYIKDSNRILLQNELNSNELSYNVTSSHNNSHTSIDTSSLDVVVNDTNDNTNNILYTLPLSLTNDNDKVINVNQYNLDSDSD